MVVYCRCRTCMISLSLRIICMWQVGAIRASFGLTSLTLMTMRPWLTSVGHLLSTFSTDNGNQMVSGPTVSVFHCIFLLAVCNTSQNRVQHNFYCACDKVNCVVNVNRLFLLCWYQKNSIYVKLIFFAGILTWSMSLYYKLTAKVVIWKFT